MHRLRAFVAVSTLAAACSREPQGAPKRPDTDHSGVRPSEDGVDPPLEDGVEPGSQEQIEDSPEAGPPEAPHEDTPTPVEDGTDASGPDEAAAPDASDPAPDPGGADDAGAQGSTPVSGVTYQRDIRPLLQANCVECHTQGGIGPTDLSQWPIVKTLGSVIVAAVSAGRMPPWPARDACHEIAESRALSRADKELFAQWRADGFQEGDAVDYIAPPPRRRQDLGPPDTVLMGDEPFTPGANIDTYRCFYLGTVPRDTFVTALDLVPGVRSQVHHIQLHRVEPEDAAGIESSDRAATGGGYPCNAGGGGASSQNMFSYRPGALAVVLNPGDAVFFKGGSGLLLQIHYNTQFLPTGVRPAPDRSSVAMWTLPDAVHPAHVIFRTGVLAPLNGSHSGGPVSYGSIPANNPHVVGESRLPMSSLSRLGGPGSPFLQGEIVGMTPHAHAWATRMEARLRRAQGSEECLVEVPDWDYAWQLDYMFRSGVPYGPDDTVHVACTYDNTVKNQPFINGMRTPVAPIYFGERTLNEMCLHYLWLRFPYADFAAANR